MAQNKNSTRAIWETAEELFKASKGNVKRSDVITACLAKKLSYCTVVTQVSAWVTARKVFTRIGFTPGVVGVTDDAAEVKPSRKARKPKAKKAPKAEAVKDAA